MLYVVMNTKEGVEVVAKDVAKEALESNNISLSYHWENIINKRLTNFNRYNLLSFATTAEHRRVFQPNEGVFFRINKEGYNEITSSEELTESITDKRSITKVNKLEKFHYPLTEDIAKSIRFLLRRLPVLANDYTDEVKNILSGVITHPSILTSHERFLQSLTIHGFYGNEKSVSFPPHTDPMLTLMIPIVTETEEDYKVAHFSNPYTKEREVRIPFRKGSVIVMLPGVIHELEYHGKTDMLSIGIEDDYLVDNEHIRELFAKHVG